jgi:ankyrin repeat protein
MSENSIPLAPFRAPAPQPIEPVPTIPAPQPIERVPNTPALQPIEWAPKHPAGRDALHRLIANNQIEQALSETRLLSPKTISRTIQKNGDGWNALHLLSYYQIPHGKEMPEEDMVGQLIEFLISMGVDTNELNGHGVAALHLASYYGNLNIVRVLVNLAEINKQDVNGMTPLDHAYLSQSPNAREIIQLLRSHGGKTEIDEITEVE